ncbi:MAG TPA: HAMP domain-containing sensor histidine kinase [Vicinamibacterales bacterium]|nr:HAMP domain-containing sensor histidine kinase [Vicinamibacterales bacterium]
MRWSVRRKSVIFIVLGCAGVGGAVALNIGWVIFSWREAGLLIAGLILFPLIITGVVLNTIFLVREMRRNEQHENFINAVTHELKTPIASVKLHLQTLQQRQVDESKRQEFYQVMVDDCDRLLGTVEQVLRAGRLRAPHERGSYRPVDLAQVMDECLTLAQTRYRLTPGELTYKATIASAAPPRVMGDEDDLKAVVLNLVDNAIKYSGDKVTIAVELAQDTRAATIRVSDRGIGIPVSELGQIFKRFYRIPGVMTARIKGAGLGLFIVRAVVARHGGTVFAESDGPGLGTTFTVQLPLTSAT